ncbi:MAG: GLUG motif-containing protein [Dehalococcoidia bacterium]
MKRVGICLIVAVLIAGMMGCPADPDPTPSLDLEIRTWYDLDAIRDNLSGHHRLMNNLDATTAGYEELASETANDGKGWQPIGARRSAFTGSFDGQGHEIRDLSINRPDEDYVGLFGNVGEGGVINNVRVVSGGVTGNKVVGGLAGHNSGTVSNSYSSVSVNGETLVGGLAGGNVGTVSNCYGTGSVTGGSSVGGVVGINSIAPELLSYPDGAMTNEGDVRAPTGSKHGTVSNCYSSGNVIGDERVGGLVGSSMGTISHSYATGNVSGDSSVGGLVGNKFLGSLSNCYSTGYVTGNEYVGGLVGWLDRGEVSGCFWNIETSAREWSAGGTGKTTAEMMDIATYTDTATEGLDEPWDIIAVGPGETDDGYIWNIVDEQTHPFLSWQSV